MSQQQARDQYISLNGLNFHYREWGDSALPPLVLLHGIRGHAGNWDRFGPQMADRFHVLALDQRGHGLTDWAGDYNESRMDEDLLAFVDALAPGKIGLVGHSMGGINAYMFTSRHPERVERLVIGDFGPDVIHSALARPGRGPGIIALEEAQRAAFADPEEAVLQRKQADPQLSLDDIRNLTLPNLRQRDDGRWVWRFDAIGLVNYLVTAPSTAEQWDAVTKIACPTLLVRGADTLTLRRDTAEKVVEVMPDCRLVELPHSGHGIMRDNPEAFLAAVRPFLLGESGS